MVPEHGQALGIPKTGPAQGLDTPSPTQLSRAQMSTILIGAAATALGRRDAGYARLDAALDQVILRLLDDPATVHTVEELAALLATHLASHPDLIGRFVVNEWVRDVALPALWGKWSGLGRIDPPEYDEFAAALKGPMRSERRYVPQPDGTRKRKVVYWIEPLKAEPVTEGAAEVPSAVVLPLHTRNA